MSTLPKVRFLRRNCILHKLAINYMKNILNMLLISYIWHTFLLLDVFSQTSIKRPPRGSMKSGLLIEVVSER